MDGGSTDDTLDILRRYEGRLAWMSGPDDGQTDAIRQGFERSHGDILAWLNSDDLYTPGAIRRAVQALEANPTAAFAYGDANIIDREGNALGHHGNRPWDLDYLINVSNYIQQPAAFFRRSAYEAVGGLSADLQYVMDYDLWIRLGRRIPGSRDKRAPRLDPHIRRNEDVERRTRTRERDAPDGARHGRKGLPDGHYADLVRAYMRAARADWSHGDRGKAGRDVAVALAHLARPRTLGQVVRWAARRTKAFVRHAALQDGRVH